MKLGLPRTRRRAARPLDNPARELHAEQRALELLQSVVGPDDYAMYRDLGFLHVHGAAPEGSSPRYGYLIYPHRPLIAYAISSDDYAGDADLELLNEYCVRFLDRSGKGRRIRLPDADDVLAKWLALHGDERGLIADANVSSPGHQVDPWQVRRDLRRMRRWEAHRRLALTA